MTAFQADRIAGFRLAAEDPAAAAAFLERALGFSPDTDAGAASEALHLRLGEARLAVARAADAGASTPPTADAPGFHHLALVVSDMAAAHARATACGARAISRGGPVRLPPASGGVTAWKFRTPQGQALELLEAPTEAWRDRARATGDLFLGVDHTALGCTDLQHALAFWRGLGFRDGPPSHNRGPEQDRLDGLDGVDLRIATLFTKAAGPHIELLRYEAPSRAGPAGVDALSVVLSGGGAGRRLEAPDGHPLILA